ncbi:hypothetical protein L4D78_02790 [Photobacterium minamisatsumaniensis]
MMKAVSKKKAHFKLKLMAYCVGIPLALSVAGVVAKDLASDLGVSGEVKEPALEHIEQSELNDLVATDPFAAFILAFDVGDELFEIQANELDGVGANVGNGERFAKYPRMDLDEYGQWAAHMPARTTGPNGQACNECHLRPFNDGAGSIAGNNVRDPKRTGDISQFITRQPPHVFGIGAKQKLAEEMTAKLHAIRDAAIAKAQNTGYPVTKTLATKGVYFGKFTAMPYGAHDFSMIEGIDEDLTIKPLQWKGVDLNIRGFVRDAENNELGLQATELVGMDEDADYDGVANELGVGDITALAIYQAGQPRPVTKTELASLGLMELSSQEKKSIKKGKKAFKQAKCDTCHKPTMYLYDPIFSEPSQQAAYRDDMFPSGDNPADHGLTPEKAIKFDLTKDMPDNVMELANGDVVNLGNFKKHIDGRTIVNIFSDLKRHDLGLDVAEDVDEKGTGESVFITQPLWGAGSTPPYMHDGRSPTIADAIMHHGGDAAWSRTAFTNFPTSKKKALVDYVNNNILLLAEEEEEGEEGGAEESSHTGPFSDVTSRFEDRFKLR